MGNNTILGKLRTQHTVTAKGNSNGTSAYLNVTNPESILVGSSMSIDGVNQVNHTGHYGGGVYGLYYTVRGKHDTSSGTSYDVRLNYTIANSFLAVGDTVYFDYDTYGLKIAKKNADVTTAGPKDTIFDSRIRRRGVVYGTGFQSSLGSSGIDFKGSKDTLGYIPLVVSSEANEGDFEYDGDGDEEDAFYTSLRNSLEFTETHIYPAEEGDNSYDGDIHPTVRTRTTGNAVTDLSFKVLRIPCAYGYMTDTYFANPQTTTDTSRGLVGGGREIKDKKRVLQGKLTNSTAGYSSKGGLFVSRAGTDIDSCGLDDILLTIDDGKGATGYRGEEQKFALNYDAVIAGTALPSTSITTSVNTSTTQTFTLSMFNPYTFSPIAFSGITTSAASSSEVTTSVSNLAGLTSNITYTLSASSGSFDLFASAEKQNFTTLSLF
jgi:hypothetical protein